MKVFVQLNSHQTTFPNTVSFLLLIITIATIKMNLLVTYILSIIIQKYVMVSQMLYV
jgi:hypothetical protein